MYLYIKNAEACSNLNLKIKKSIKERDAIRAIWNHHKKAEIRGVSYNLRRMFVIFGDMASSSEMNAKIRALNRENDFFKGMKGYELSIKEN